MASLLKLQTEVGRPAFAEHPFALRGGDEEVAVKLAGARFPAAGPAADARPDGRIVAGEDALVAEREAEAAVLMARSTPQPMVPAE